MFSKILIANRGEIAVRVMRACAEMGIRTVAVYSDADAQALHVRRADEGYHIGASPASASYLNVERIVEVARRSGAEAIHPGYGFLSENPQLAEACRQAGIVFIGPSPEAMRRLGSKREAKTLARRAGVPVVPGYDGDAQDTATLAQEAQRIGFPLLIKASAGGGGRGMRVVPSPEAFKEALESAKREAQSAFGDDAVLLERLIDTPRHVEFQVLADTHGNVVHLGERECSVQRRHQKVIEESPSIALAPERREAMGAAAVALMRAADYVNTGTVEFILAPSGEYFFLEVNTRLQVEHPVTEMVTGIDLVREQLRIAAGLPLSVRQEEIGLRGHAIECRVYAEDVAFRPSTGPVLLFQPANGPGIRNDVGVTTGDEVTPYYDPMLAKLIVSAPDRAACIARSLIALESYAVLGVTTNVPLLQRILDAPAFRQGHVSTTYLDEHLSELIAPLKGQPEDVPPRVLLTAAAWEVTSPRVAGEAQDWSPWRMAGQTGSAGRTLRFGSSGAGSVHVVHVQPGPSSGMWVVDLSDGRHEITATRRANGEMWVREGASTWTAWVADTEDTLHISYRGSSYQLHQPRGIDVDDLDLTGTAAASPGCLEAPLTGTVSKVHVREEEDVQEGQTLIVLEAMKTEIGIAAPHAGRVKRLSCTAGDLVQAGMVLAELEHLTLASGLSLSTGVERRVNGRSPEGRPLERGEVRGDINAREHPHRCHPRRSFQGPAPRRDRGSGST